MDRNEWLAKCAARFRQIVDVDWYVAEYMAEQNAAEQEYQRGPDPSVWLDPETLANEDVRVWAGKVI